MFTTTARRSAAVTALLAAGIVFSACSASSPTPSDGADGPADALKVAILTSGAVSDNGYNADAKRAADMM
jgi:hypothetical protein